MLLGSCVFTVRAKQKAMKAFNPLRIAASWLLLLEYQIYKGTCRLPRYIVKTCTQAAAKCQALSEISVGNRYPLTPADSCAISRYLAK